MSECEMTEVHEDLDACLNKLPIPAQIDELAENVTQLKMGLSPAIYLHRKIKVAMHAGLLNNAEQKRLTDVMDRLSNLIDWANREFK
jgi:hypothetical protein